MATKAKVSAPKVKKEVKYFTTRLHGLKVIVNDQVTDPTLVEYVRFTAVKERFQGDNIKVGYLKTDNKVAITKLLNDPNVTEITADEFKKATTKAGEPEVEEVIEEAAPETDEEEEASTEEESTEE